MTKDHIHDQALSATEGRKRCGVGVTMGGGKTNIGLRHMVRLFKPGDEFLVVAPKTSIFETWREEAVKFNLEYLLPHITFTTYISLPKQHQNYKAIYLDECHNLLYTHNSWLTGFGGYILGLTGTRPRYRCSEKGEMIAKYCPIVFTYITDEAVEDGLLNDYRIIIHHFPLNHRKTIRMTNKSTGAIWYQSEEEAYTYWNNRLSGAEMKVGELEEQIQQISEKLKTVGLSTKLVQMQDEKRQAIKAASESLSSLRIMRMRVLQGFETKVRYTKWMLKRTVNKAIVFANTRGQAERICNHSYHSKNPNNKINLDLFKRGEINCLSSIMQLSEGKNIPGLREGFILHAYSNERKSSQRLGRLLRLNPDDVSLSHVLCYDGTIDEKWVREALQDFDPEKIFHYYPLSNQFFNIYGEPVENIKMPWGLYHPPVVQKAAASV